MTNQETYTKSKRIASNTVILFVRMFIMMVINLYAVRYVLNGLGKSDFGLFTTVASVVAITSMLNVVLALSIQRIYSFFLGKKDTRLLNEIFSSSINIVIILAVCAFVLLETIGLWLVYTQLTIPPDQMDATLWVYQLSIFILILSMLQIPYTAAIFAHEDMGVYTWISTAECLLKFAAAFSITYAFINHLVFYALGLLVTAIIVFVMYVFIARHKYQECHYHKPTDKKIYKKLISFSGWTFFGSAANTGIIQGNTILLNVFFGPIINAAFGIAQQINNVFNTLCNTMVLAFRPPMIKAYAEQNYNYLNKLFSVCNKFIFYLLLMVAIPIMSEMDTILSLWLGNTSPDITLFSRLIIIYVICLAMNSPITIIMQASGRLKEYHLPVETITLLCLPITWILFAIGLPSYFVFVSMISVCILAHIVRLYILKRYYHHFHIRIFLVSFVFPALVIMTCSIAVAYLIHKGLDSSFLRFLLSICSSFVMISFMVYLIGLEKNEKNLLRDFIKSFIINKVCRR